MIIMAPRKRHNQKTSRSGPAEADLSAGTGAVFALSDAGSPEPAALPGSFPAQTDTSGRTGAFSFDEIAHRYDLLNLLLSAGFDRLWRRAAVRLLGNVSGLRCLDAATGTGRIAQILSRRGARVTGIDSSKEMLRIARRRLQKEVCAGAVFLEADCERLPFPAGSFDAAAIGFGIRNMRNPDRALAELFRVCKPGGKIVVLEFSRPDCRIVRFLFDIYFFRVLPLAGRIVSGHRSAYSYLPASVAAFAQGEAFAGMMRSAGFSDVRITPLTFGIASLYRGVRP